MALSTDLPFLFQPIKIVETSSWVGVDSNSHHFDLLSFLSIVSKFKVDFVSITWQPALQSLGQGASAQISQAQVDTLMYLAFKRLNDTGSQASLSTDLVEEQQFKTLISEVVALEALRGHPNVIDLLGITWETDKESLRVLPVLLTERSQLGNLADFLRSEDGKALDAAAKLRMCCDVARACGSMHDLGIVHGDIKLENVLVFQDDQDVKEAIDLAMPDRGPTTYLVKVIDFGYSCLGGSELDLVRVPRTRPWQAPEHRVDDFVSLKDAQKMDVYSFGILLCRIFLPDLLSILGRHCSKGHLLDEIDAMKRQPIFLGVIEGCFSVMPDLSTELKAKIGHILGQSLQHDPAQRKIDFSQIVEILTTSSDSESISIASPVNLESLTHEIFNISDVLASLDDEDYLLKEQIFLSLKARVENSKCSCTKIAARNLGLCYEIGFGTPRNSSKAQQYLTQADLSQKDLEDILHVTSESYEPSEPLRLQEKLGYNIALPFDPVLLYRIQDRLEPALQAIEKETIDRRDSFGEFSRPYLAQMSNLMLFLINDRQLDKAADVGAQTVETCEKLYGPMDSQTINAYNFLAFVLFRSGRWTELEQLQLELIPRKEQAENLGPRHATTLNSRNYLVSIYCLQNRYNECIEAASKLVALRHEIIGDTHPETITTETWMVRALLESGQLSDLENMVTDLLRRSKQTHGDHEISTLQVQEILASTMLALATGQDSDSFDEDKVTSALRLATDIVDAVDTDQKDVNLLTPEDSDTTDFEDDDDPTKSRNGSTTEGVSNSKLVSLGDFETLVLLRSTTTMICALALLGNMDNAEEEIKFIQTELRFEGLRAELELAAFNNVVAYVSELKPLDGVPNTAREAHAIRKKLAHRWSLSP